MVKRTCVHVTAVLLVIVMMIGMSACDSSSNGTAVVYITDYGDCYHTYNCQYLWNSKNEITLSKAVKKGYRSCTVCNPPILS